jgi:uncharacterized membrane protein
MATVTVKMAMTPVQKKVRKILKWFIRLNFLAILITLYLTYMHYKPDASEICVLSDTFNCDIVNKSSYAELFGVPVAILGLMAYLFLFGSAIALTRDMKFYKYLKFLRPIRLMWIMFGVTAAGVLFSGYLTYIELFVLEAICIFCLAQQIIIVIDIFMMLSILSTIDEGKKKNPNVCEFC